MPIPPVSLERLPCEVLQRSAPCLTRSPRAALADESASHNARLFEGESFGLFASERKARNALGRLAARHRLCHGLLGLAHDCVGCAGEVRGAGCSSVPGRKKQLPRLFTALRPLRIDAWPYGGPIGIRERADVHVVDRWQFLGTARNDADVHELVGARRPGFDKHTYALLARELAKAPRERILYLVTRVDGDQRITADGERSRARASAIR